MTDVIKTTANELNFDKSFDDFSSILEKAITTSSHKIYSSNSANNLDEFYSPTKLLLTTKNDQDAKISVIDDINRLIDDNH